MSLDAALPLIRRGWAVVPIPAKEKSPRYHHWQNLRITEANAKQYFNGGNGNVGVLLGEPSGGLTDIDLDGPETMMLADRFLPATDAEFGRNSKPRSHRLYRVSEGHRRIAYKDPLAGKDDDAGMLVEFRCSGPDDAGTLMVVQTVFPGSVHPSGETVEWDTDGEPTEIDTDELRLATARLAVAALIIRHLPIQYRAIIEGNDEAWAKALNDKDKKLGSAARRWLGIKEEASRAPAKRKPKGGAPPNAQETYAQRALDREADRVSSTGPGTQNDTLFNAAANMGELIATGAISEGEVESTLVSAGLGMSASKEPWTVDQVRQKVRDGIAKGMAQPRDLTGIGQREPSRDTHRQAQTPPPLYDPETGVIDEPYPGDIPDGPEDEPRPPEFSDDALALEFTAAYKDQLRHVAQWGRWLIWDGQRWASDETLQSFGMARRICRAASRRAIEIDPSKMARIAASVASAKTVASIEKLAKSDRDHALSVDAWDQDPWLLNTPSGAVDLRTGISSHARQSDYMTKITAVSPFGDCPLWRQFLGKVTAGDVELQGYLQRLAGYALTGITREHSLVFFYGTGGNGKGVFLNTINAILSGYAAVAAIETFTASSGERHPTDLAMLRGSRLVTAQETEQGRHWAESRIKAMTGGDPLTARFMRQDFFTYTPQFKLVIAGNHKPALRNVDEAIRRRFHLVPFTVTIPASERDERLPEKLKGEWAGILKWAIDGCLTWQNFGLAPPQSVLDATADYLGAEDSLGRWLQECCDTSRPALDDLTETLFASWKAWTEKGGERTGNVKAFSQELQNRGFLRTLQPGTKKSMFQGISVIRPDTSEEWHNR